jgi:hypothetical protein
MGVAYRRAKERIDPRVPVVAVGGGGGRVRRVVVVRLRWVGASVGASTACDRAVCGVLAGLRGDRGGVVGGTQWPIRAACPP